MNRKNKVWRLRRWIVEEYEVTAKSRKEALEKAENPSSVTITKETCIIERNSNIK